MDPEIEAAKREANRRRQTNLRDRRAGRPETYPRASTEELKEIQRREVQNVEGLAWAKEQDATGKYYKSECRSCVDLFKIYEGANILDQDSDEDDETVDGEKKKYKTYKKKEKRPNPSQQILTIRAIELPGGIKLEPNCDFEFRKIKEVDKVVTFQEWLEFRDKARKDLLWLGRLLGKGLFHSVHQYICDQFVQKNFDGMYFPGYTIDDFHEMVEKQKRFANVGTDVVLGITLTREMILLESRGGYKSTINGVDAVQWLINCPDIRIMFITAFRHLAKKLAKEIKKYFYLSLKAEPTAFQLLFPEFVLTGVAGRSKEPILCPARNVWSKEDSLWVTSMESSSIGDHVDILKGDDVVDPKNSADDEMRAELKFEFDSIKNDNCDPWGFIDITGTRYFTTDMYGARFSPNAETKRVAPFKYSCRGCWTLLAEDQLAYDKGELTLSEIIEQKRAKLTFPYKLGWAKLRNILDEKDARNFKNQQLNEPTDATKDEAYINYFTEDVLRAHCYPYSSAPKEGDIVQAWDYSYGDKKTSDFSVGVTAKIYQKANNQYALVVLDIIFEKWKASELVPKMVAFYEKWKPKTVLIEKALGSDFLLTNIANYAFSKNSDMTSHIRWHPISVLPNAKRNRIKDLEFLLGEERLYIVTGPWIDEMFKQLCDYKGGKSTTYRKDDIPDAMALLIEFLPKASLKRDASAKEIEREAEKQKAIELNKAWHRRMWGGHSTAPPPAITTPAPEPQPDPRRAMLNRLFGNNGMRG